LIDSSAHFLARNGTRFMAFGLFVGLVVPPLSALLGPMLPMVVWVVLYLSMLRVDWGDIIAWRQRPLIVIGGMAFILLISPLMMWLVLTVMGADKPLATGLVLMAASAPYTAVAAVAAILYLDAALALVLLVLTTLLMPFVLPGLVVDGLGFDVALDSISLMKRLGVVVGIAVALAVVSRHLIGKERLARNAHRLDGLVVIMILGFAIALMDGVTAAASDQPARVGVIIAAACAANVGLQCVAALTFWRFGRKLALTIGYASGNGNLAIILAVLPENAHPDIALYFALGQFPMFLFPMLSRPLFRWLLRKE
jgi:bile acid:Na+ symporter, BASS family